MPATFTRQLLIVIVLALTFPVTAQAQALPVQEIHLRIDAPAYTELPVWVKADLAYPFEARYPYSEDASDFGPNQIEVEHDGKLLAPRTFPAFASSARAGGQDGSAAPPTSPTNRLPLHMQYSIAEPGTYSVRWTAIRHGLAGDRPTVEIVARSNWFNFEVKPSTPEQREAWLVKELAAVPDEPGRLVGDYLPSLLVASPDPRALHILMELLYSNDALVSSYALSSLGLFRREDVRTQGIDILHRRGPTDRLAYLLSWAAQFQDDREDLVRTMLPYLRSAQDRQVAAALQLFSSKVHPAEGSWPADSEISSQVDRAVLAVAPKLAKRGDEVRQMLALYLGGIKSDESRGLLWQLAEGTGPGHQQALIVLTWLGDSRDLPRLGDCLLKPGDPDPYGRDLSSLPYALLHGYGDRAIPYLEHAISDSPYVFVRTNSAEQLILKGRPLAFNFFLDAVQHNRFYKRELAQWLTDYCGLPRGADDQALIAFLNSRLGR